MLAFFRDTSDDTAKEIVQLNALYMKNKSRNFKAVVMIIAGESSKKWLEELNRSTRLEIPLTFFTKGPKDVAARVYNLNPAVANTFLVTVDRSVVANISGYSGAVQPRRRRRVGNARHPPVIARIRRPRPEYGQTMCTFFGDGCKSLEHPRQDRAPAKRTFRSTNRGQTTLIVDAHRWRASSCNRYSENDGLVEGKPPVRAIPSNEVFDRGSIGPLGFLRSPRA